MHYSPHGSLEACNIRCPAPRVWSASLRSCRQTVPGATLPNHERRAPNTCKSKPKRQLLPSLLRCSGRTIPGDQSPTASEVIVGRTGSPWVVGLTIGWGEWRDLSGFCCEGGRQQGCEWSGKSDPDPDRENHEISF